MALAGLVDIIGAFLPAVWEKLERLEKLMPFHAHHTGGRRRRPRRRGAARAVDARPSGLPAGLRRLGRGALREHPLDAQPQRDRDPGRHQRRACCSGCSPQHGQFRVMPAGRSHLLQWMLAAGLGTVALVAVLLASLDRDEQLARNSIALVVGILVLVGISAARPGRWRPRTGAERAEAMEKARHIVATHGGDTLDYFALRDDKAFLFSGDGLVAYTVLDRTMLISPDPICPPEQRAEVISDAIELADSPRLGHLGPRRQRVVAADLPRPRDARDLHGRRGRRRLLRVHASKAGP